MISGVGTEVRIYNIHRFTQKFEKRFNKELESPQTTPIDKRTWNIVESCTSCLDMLKATLLFHLRFPQIDKEDVRVAKQWLNRIKSSPVQQAPIVDQKKEGHVEDHRSSSISPEMIRSGLQFIYSGLGKDPGTITEMDLIEMAYYLEEHKLYHCLLINYLVDVEKLIEYENFIELARILTEIEGSSLKDEKVLKDISRTISKFLGTKLLSDRSLIEYYKKLKVPKLSFHVFKKEPITIDLLEALSQCPHLKELEFILCMLNKALIDKLPKHLESVIFIGLYSSEDKLLDNLPMGLRSFTLRDSDLSDSMLSNLPALVCRLTLDSCYNITDAVAEHFSDELTYLDLSSNPKLTDNVLKNRSKKLTHLFLNELKITDEGMKLLPEGLQVLDIYQTLVTDAGIERIPRDVLELSLNKDISDEGLAKVPPKLRKISMRDNKKITGAGLSKLPVTVFHLNLMGARVTDADIQGLHDNIREINLARTAVTGNFSLPKGVLILQLYSSRYLSQYFAKLHEGLLELDITDTKLKSGEFEKIPRSVLVLNIHQSFMSEISNLPPDLLSFDISYCPSIPNSELHKVPKSIKCINIDGGIIDKKGAAEILSQACVIKN